MAELKVYTTDQVSKIISREKKTIYRAIKDGKLIAHKLGKGYLVFESDLINYIQNAPVGKKNTAEQLLAK